MPSSRASCRRSKEWTGSDPQALEPVSQQIGEFFTNGMIPAEIALAISEAYAELLQLTNLQPSENQKSVAVRSSATAEDLPGASFAGQQDTYLNIRGEQAVLEAVKRCWASLWTARAMAYRARQNIAPDEVALAVVVQELVFAEAAGVMFTANPVNGRRDELMITAAWGLGEAIVSGAVTPDTITVNKSTGRPVRRETAEKLVMTVRTEAGTTEQPVPGAPPKSPGAEQCPGEGTGPAGAWRSKNSMRRRWISNGRWRAESSPSSRPGR